jgi:hypothetical protein
MPDGDPEVSAPRPRPRARPDLLPGLRFRRRVASDRRLLAMPARRDLPRPGHRGLRSDQRIGLVQLPSRVRTPQCGTRAVLVAMGSPSRLSALALVSEVHGIELRGEVILRLPRLVRQALKRVELTVGDSELIVDAVITDLDGTEAWLEVATFTLDELAERYPDIGLAW